VGAWEGKRRVVILSEENWEELCWLVDDAHPNWVSDIHEDIVKIVKNAQSIQVQYDPPPKKLHLVEK